MLLKNGVACAIAFTLGIASAHAAPIDYVASKIEAKQNKVYVSVVIYDVLPGKAAEFESKLLATNEPGRASTQSLINDRVLRNVDDITLQYATYTKFKSAADAQAAIAKRVDNIRTLLRRAPEIHQVVLDRLYSPAGMNANPVGTELAAGKTGQIAHLGLFLPDPKSARTYYETLYKVKDITVSRKPEGYLADELLIEPQISSAAAQAPYTPRPTMPTYLSVNYGEYNTLENAEDSYIARAQQVDPNIAVLDTRFFSSLQVPNRFYIFKVIGNS
jgi:hypothetical protein